MTFLGFIVAVLIIGGIFYAWYAFVHRNGVYNAAQGGQENRQAAMKGTNRMRPTSSMAMETGTIGEREKEEKQGKYVEGAAANSGYIPRNVLNPDHGYNVEAGTIGEVEQKPQAQAQKQQSKQSLVAEIHEAFQMEAGSIGETAPKQAQAQPQKEKSKQSLVSEIHQAFQAELGEIGGGQQQAQERARQPQAQSQAGQQSVNPAQLQDQPMTQQALQVSGGAPQDLQAQQMAQQQMQAPPHNFLEKVGDVFSDLTQSIASEFAAPGQAQGGAGMMQQAQQPQQGGQGMQASQADATVYAQGLQQGFAAGFAQGQKVPDSNITSSTKKTDMSGVAGTTNDEATATNATATNAATGGGQDVTDIMNQTFRDEFYSPNNQQVSNQHKQDR